MSDKKVCVILPVVGKPYVAADMDGDNLDDLKKIVDGYVEWVKITKSNYTQFMIHPMFINEQPRWAVAHKIIKSGKPKMMVLNEEGACSHSDCCANMAVLVIRPQAETWGLKPVMGMCAIVIKKGWLGGIDTENILPYKNFMEDESEDESEEDE